MKKNAKKKTIKNKSIDTDKICKYLDKLNVKNCILILDDGKETSRILKGCLPWLLAEIEILKFQILCDDTSN